MRKLLSLFLLLFISCTPVKMAHDTFEQGDFKSTIASCKSILATDSTNADVLFLMGQSFYQLQQIDSALVAFELASYYQPDNAKYREKYYLTVIERGELFLPDDTASALDYFDKAVRIDTSNAVAVEKKSDLFFDLQKYELAKSNYLTALQLGGDTLHIKNQLASIDSLQNSAERYVQEGLAAMEKNKYDAAKKLFQKALDEKPDYKEAQYQLHMATGLRLYKKGSVNALWDALDSFGRASFVFPDRGEPHYFTGLAYTKKDKDEYVNAIEALEKAAHIEPDGKWAEPARNEAERIRARKKKMDAFYGR